MGNKKMRKILVVDDHSFIRDMMVEALGSVHEVETAADGAEGLEKWRNGNFDLVLSDIDMPKMSGEQMLREMKKEVDVKDIRLVFISGGSYPTELGFMDFMAKPFDLYQLYTMVNEWTDCPDCLPC